MARLIFYDARHEYTVDGEKYPSVSEILRFISREIYDDTNQYALDHAADRGTSVHKATENIDRYGSADIEDEYAGYVQAYVSFLREHDVIWSDIEKPMYHPVKHYAGTIDRFGVVDGFNTLVDIKTNATIKKPLVKAQLNGYEDMRQANEMTPAERLCCLQLKSDGTYRMYPCAVDMTEFDACYALHTALARKQKRGEIE